MNGAEDKLTYANELFRLQQELRNSKRNTVIVSKEIPRPTPQEISEIKRSNYTSGDQMLLGL
ncbi:MAG: YceG family protein, partial [Blautia sp.]|nr:YceG family protein [Blautia sp.]